jgi:ABC-2 type transport system ATP-binding protein
MRDGGDAQRMSDAAIDVCGLSVRRGGRLVLREIDLSIGGARVTGLLGPSGSGKTTLMRCIVGLQVVERGTVLVHGERAGSPRLRRALGYVTQAASVYDDLTVAENLRYFAAVLDAPPSHVEDAIDAVDLRLHRNRIVRTLSGGERSRVSLAAALVGRPTVLVLDEPTVGLDPVLRRDLWEMFHRLAQDGVTVVVSSHVMDEAERCDDLVLMREGRIVAAAAPGDLLARTGAHDLEAAFLALVEPAA